MPPGQVVNYNEERLENPDFLHLRLRGSWNRDTSRRSMQTILRLLDNSDQRLLLIDDTGLESSNDVTLDYEEGIFMVEQLHGRCRRVAILVRPDEVEANEFFATVCQNRGLQLRIFGSQAAAERWLLAARPD